MFKKFLFLLPLTLLAPLVVDSIQDTHVLVASASEEIKGEYDGYTYTAKGNERYYDTHDLAPTIVKNFWAPKGYKYTLNLREEQIDDILDQADGVGCDYSYIVFTLSYTKFGMEIYVDTLINEFENRDDCKDWIIDRINNYEPFHEVREATVETDISIIFDFYFVTAQFASEYPSYKFHFVGDVMAIEPFKESDCIDFKLQYYFEDHEDDEKERRIDIWCSPIRGFFNEEPDHNPYGFTTDETEMRYSQDADGVVECPVYEFKLYAYGTIELANLGVHGVEITSLPSYPLPCKIKLEFVSGGVTYEYWTEEFFFGDPGFCVTIDGYTDRSTIQRNSTHLYGVNYDNLNEVNNYSFSFDATAYPLRLNSGPTIREYYDRAIEPDNLYDYYLLGSFNDWVKDDRYVFTETSENHYILRNVPLTSGTEIRVHTTQDQFEYYQNYTTWEDCGFIISGFWDDVTLINDGNYDIEFILGREDHNHIFLTRVGDYEVPQESEEELDYYLVGTFNDWTVSDEYKLTKDSSNSNHYILNNKLLTEGDEFQIRDSAGHLISSSKNWECSGFRVAESGNLVSEKTRYVNINYYVRTSHNYSIVLSSCELDNAPVAEEENFVFYIPSNEEVRLHAEGKDEEFLNEYAGGNYYVWDKELLEYDYYQGEELLNFDINSEEDGTFDVQQTATIPYAGEWIINLRLFGTTDIEWIYCQLNTQTLTVVAGDDTEDTILLNVPDEVNILNGADKLAIVPSVSSYNPEMKYYYDWTEPTKEGVVELEEQADGILVVTPVNNGVVELTVTVECELFSPIERTISIRVLDAIYDVAKIKVPDEFHYAGKDLTASISIRGFTRIQNVKIEWKVTNKKGAEVPKEKLVVNNDATITLKKAESDDYTFVAYYEGVKLDTLKVQVRFTDINKFLRANIWWVVLITIAAVFLVLFLNKLTHAGMTTVQAIDKVYGVFCSCISDDKLTKTELKTIRKEIARCLRRCEDLNIEALNQYEKAIRYLRKSLVDTNNLLNNWDTISIEDKSAFTEKLNLDLSKALNVAREIENAKELIEQYHTNANKKNYETITDESKSSKKKQSSYL